MYEYFSLRITKDKMRAYLTVLYDNLNETITVDGILDYLQSKGICFGICKEEIEKTVENKYLISNLLVAKGEGLSESSDSFVEYDKEIGCSIIPKTGNDGFVDFSAIKEPVYVHKGDRICSIKVPTDKLDCTDIYGRKFVLGESSYLPAFGQGVEYRRNETAVYALLDGCVDYEDNIIDVIPAHIIRDNTANGSYVGNVVIYSQINEGMTIKSDENIVICGDIKNVNIEAGGSIVVHGSIQDDGKCMIRAGKNIVCRDISTVNLYCGGSVYSTKLTKCIAKAGKSIMVNGVGQIASGRYTAGESVIANVLGNEGSNNLIINIWENWYNIENNTGEDEHSQLIQCEEDLSELRDQYMQLGKSLDTLKNMEYVSGENANRSNIIRYITLVRAQVMHSIAVHRKKYEKIADSLRSKKREIACSGEIFRGVQFRIGQTGYTVPDNTSNRVFYLNGENVFLYRQYK